MNYANLEQRVAQSYIDMFPAFVPEENAPVSAVEQKLFYDLMRSLYQLAFDEPLLFVTKLHEDDAYPTRIKNTYGKPNLITDMRKLIKAVDTLTQKMIELGQGKDAKLNKRELVMLSKLGIDDFDMLPAAWVWMAKRDDISHTAFSYCLFRKNHSYAMEIYLRFLGGTAYDKLTAWMLENGYEAYDIYDVTASDCKLSLSIVNPKWSKEKPRGGHEYGIKHTGISVQYDYYAAEPVLMGLCIPNGMKPYLSVFGEMEPELQQFVASRTKKCDACGYCTQTDKTGTRKTAFITVEHENDKYNLCTYFPGYYYSWAKIDDEIADDLIKMLEFMDSTQN